MSGPDLPKHIPGSLHFATMREALQSLNRDDEIIVYCSDENCIASTALGQLLERHGYLHVLHFAGGLAEWEQAGYTLEGEWINAEIEMAPATHSIPRQHPTAKF